MSDSKMTKSIEAAQGLVDVLTDDDYISVLAFNNSTTEIVSQTKLVTYSESGEKIDNRQSLKDKLSSLRGSGGTVIESVLEKSLNYKTEDSQYQSFIILLSDGQSSVSNQILQKLKENGQKVITVGIGNDVDQSLMQRIADMTGGSYLFCENAEDLTDAFIDLQNIYIGSTKDTDGDGLPDLVETTGMRDQYGEIWITDPNNPDTDGDGYSDGEEMGEYKALAVHPYFSRESRPDLYTVKSDEAYIAAPDSMQYAIQRDEYQVLLRFYVTDLQYRMVPDLITPIEEDGIPKEYIYSQPENLKAELTRIPDGCTVESIETVKEDDKTYRTDAVLSYSKSTTLDTVQWKVTADNCSEWSGYYSMGEKVAYISEEQKIEMIQAAEQEEEEKNYNYENNLLRESLYNMASQSKILIDKVYSNAESKEDMDTEITKKLARLKEQIIATPSNKNLTVPDAVYESFALAILSALAGSDIDMYETDQNKLIKQIATQIEEGIGSGINVVTIDGTQYTANYTIFASSGIGVAINFVTWGSNRVDLSWTNANSEEGIEALAEYCAVLAQLNNDVWKEFLAYYTSDLFGLSGFTSVTTENARNVLDCTEKIIKAMCNKKDADALVNEIGSAAGEKLKSGWSNQFKKFVKNSIPNGENIVKTAETFKKAMEAYDEWNETFNEYANEGRTDKNLEKVKDKHEKFNTKYYELLEKMNTI